jgi:hypothetical protein
MRKILTGLLASAALLGLATSAFAMGDCGWGHTKQVMASTVEEEATTLSTYDGDVKLPDSVSEADEPSAVVVPTEDESFAE